MFICGQCGKEKAERYRVFAARAEDDEWCQKCYTTECKRSMKEDAAPGSIDDIACFRTRPPKYMLSKSEYQKYGY